MNLKKFDIISNTTPIIALASIGKLELLPKGTLGILADAKRRGLSYPSLILPLFHHSIIPKIPPLSS